jgi:hypothetical protein
MTLPPSDTPLYNHPLPDIEQWLTSHGCQRDHNDVHRWHVKKQDWAADICMEIDCLIVRYLHAGADGKDIQRSFKYSLSRKDLDDAIFSGP